MKRHATDIVSLIFGVLFVGTAAWWFIVFYLGLRLRWNVPGAGWFLAGGLILVGLLGVAASLRRDRERPEDTPAPGPTENPDLSETSREPADEPTVQTPTEHPGGGPSGDQPDEPGRGVG